MLLVALAQDRARRRRLAPVCGAHAAEGASDEWIVRSVHPMAWIVWATSAGFVAFVTTDPVYLLLLWAVSWFVYAEPSRGRRPRALVPSVPDRRD